MGRKGVPRGGGVPQAAPQTPRPIILHPPFLIPGYDPAYRYIYICGQFFTAYINGATQKTYTDLVYMALPMHSTPHLNLQKKKISYIL